MSTWIDAITSPLKLASETIQGLVNVRDQIKIGDTVIKLQAQILAAQQGASAAQERETALLERIRELEKEVTDLKAWEAQKQRYQLTEVGAGAFAYVVKPDAQGSEPEHLICPTCYEQGDKLVLQAIPPIEQRGRGDIRTCPKCKTAVAVARNPDWKPSPNRRW